MCNQVKEVEAIGQLNQQTAGITCWYAATEATTTQESHR